MPSPDSRVEVEPDSVHRVIEALRSCSREYSAAAGRLCTNLPVMAPLIFLHTELELDIAAARLHALAVRLDYAAAVEANRILVLRGADGGDVSGVVRDLFGDLGGEARRLVGDVRDEPGWQASVNPLAWPVHVVVGVVENLGQLWQEAEMAGRLGPGYGNLDPAGGQRARQQAIATCLNFIEIAGTWDGVDPGISQRARNRAFLKALDWKDLADRDLPRWAGHVGSGLVLGEMVAGIAGGADEIAAGGLVESGYEGLNGINKVPSDRDQKGDPSPDELVARAEKAFSGFLGQPSPSRNPAP